MNNLKDLRVSAGLSRKDVAKALGIKESAVGKWEIGKSLPTADKLTHLARLYRCQLDDMQLIKNQ